METYESTMPVKMDLDIGEIIYDIENDSTEIKPRLVLNYPDGTLAYVYKDTHGKSWLEFAPDVISGTHPRLSKYIENILDFSLEDNEDISCVEVDIKNEEEFLVKNIDFILDPPDTIKMYLWHSKLLSLVLGFSICIELLLMVIILANSLYNEF